VTHTATYNNSVMEGFSTGTIATLAWNKHTILLGIDVQLL